MTDLNLTEKILKEFNAQFVGVDQYGLIKTCRQSDVKRFILKAISQTAESAPVYDVGAGVLELKDGEKCSVSKHNGFNEHVDLVREWQNKIKKECEPN